MSENNFWWPVAKKFFITGARASSETKKGTVQEAFIKAKINPANLVPVSSVLNPDAVRLTNPPTIPHSAITFCVMAEEMGTKGNSIAAGIGYCYMRSKDGSVKKAYVVEDHGPKEERAVKETLMLSLVDMAEAEGLVIFNPTNTQEILLGRQNWLEEQIKAGKHFDGWKSPESAYLKYLDDNGGKFIVTEIHGYDKIPDDYGYAVAALVFVFDDDNKGDLQKMDG